MLNGVPFLLLRLSSNRGPNLSLENPGFFGGHLFPVLSPRNINESGTEEFGRVTGSRSELILYFKSKFQTWVGKLRGDSVSRVLFSAGLRHPSGLRCAQLKLFSTGGTFR